MLAQLRSDRTELHAQLHTPAKKAHAPLTVGRDDGQAAGALLQLDVERTSIPFTQDHHLDLILRLLSFQTVGQAPGSANRLTVELDDDVAALQSRLVGW